MEEQILPGSIYLAVYVMILIVYIRCSIRFGSAYEYEGRDADAIVGTISSVLLVIGGLPAMYYGGMVVLPAIGIVVLGFF